MNVLRSCNGGSSGRDMFAPPVREKRLGSHGRNLLWLQMLLVVLLAGQASCDQTTVAPTSTLPLTTTVAPSSVQYFLKVSVDVTGQTKEEADIKAWLIDVFQNKLGSCTLNSEGTTPAPNYTQTTPANISNETTLHSQNTTTTATSVTVNNNTTAALDSNITTTAITLTTLSNNTTPTSTMLETSNTTTATTTTTSESRNTTTAATTTTSESRNTTTAITTTSESSNTTTATTTTTTTESSNTTTAITQQSTTTPTTTSTTSSNTTTAQQSTTTTTPSTTSSNTTTAQQSTTTTTPSTTSSNTTTAQQSTTTTTPSTTSSSTATTTTSATTQQSTTPTTPSTTSSSTASTTTTTTATTQQSTTTPTTPSTTSSSTATTQQSTTTPTTPSTTSSSTATTTTTATTQQSTTTPTTPSTTSSSTATTTTTPTTPSTTSSSTARTTTTTTITTPATTSSSTARTTTTTVTTPSTTSSSTATTQPSTTTSTSRIPPGLSNSGNAALINPNPVQSAIQRVARDISSIMTQSRISNNTTDSPFQSMTISCNVSTSITNTECFVTVELKQTVPACCILRTLCAASKASSVIHVVGNKAYRDQPQNTCNGNLPEEYSCTYTGPTSLSCEASGVNYVASQSNSTNCGPVTVNNNNCSCSAYCSGTDAYYIFQISIQSLTFNVTYALSLISEKLKQAKNCTPSATVSCPLSVLAYEYKTTSVTCGSIVANRQSCSVILDFSHVVPICAVAAALVEVFQSQNQISYDGLVTRAAICGNSDVLNKPPTRQFTWLNVMPSSFCMAVQQSNNLTCQNGENVVVQLGEQCVQTTPLNTTTTNQSTNTTSNDTAVSQANALLNMTKDVSALNSSQVDELVSQLESLLSGPNISLALGNTSINIVSNLLGASPETLSRSSNRIIRIVDTVALKLVLQNTAETILSPSVALAVKPADGTNFQETVFSISDPNNAQVRGNPRLRRAVTTVSSIPQGSAVMPTSLTKNLTLEQQKLATRVQFNFYQKSTVFQDISLGVRKLNSGILGASVANLSITGLKDNVTIYLKNTKPIPANYEAKCVFWDVTLNNRSGGWNPSGCYVLNTTDNETVCSCNHLTSFAILLDISRPPLSADQNTVLTFITYIGCGVSSIFLSITLLTYLSFGKLRKDIPSKILIQLCFALLLLNLVFLVDAWLALYTDAVGLCISTAWFLHYFLLVSFTWMGLEAVHMYMAIVKVFNSYISNYMLKFSLAGWGIPMIVVIIVIAIDKNNYGLVSYAKLNDGSDDFCWLKNNIAFYVAVVAYYCVIFLFNLIMFIVVLVQLRRIKRQNPQSVQHRSILQDVRSVAGITVLLGLTWGFAFFAQGDLYLPFTYLFTIINSLQGLFIFVFYCAMKENVRRQWRTYLCCGKMRLAENSEWSRTATQKTVKKSKSTKLTPNNSSKSKKSKKSNNSSSSSFLVNDSSEQMNGFSSPFEDRVITADEDPSRDVILNEINSQYGNQQPTS